MKLIIATQNKNKVKEIKKILKGLGLKISCLCEDKKFNVREDGKTFIDNAVKKAMAASKKYKDCFVVGEDSGLEVFSLGGEPGVYSKRYAGPSGNPIKNNNKLLRKLKKAPLGKRRARFICTIALVKNDKLIKKVRGVLSGYISQESCGSNGFGYDPVFYLSEYKKTVAELSSLEKNKISHRAKAFLLLKDYLAKYLEK